MKRLCERCGEDGLRRVWTSGRRLRDECASDSCDWHSEPFTPPQKEIETTRTAPSSFGGVGGWTYQVFDQYGHTLAYSRGYSTEAECETEARKHVARNTAPPTGPCRAVIWPPTVEVHGRLLT